MADPLILASKSATRIAMLQAAGVEFEAVAARVDEDAIKDALLAEGVSPRDIADALAEAKARKVSGKHPEAYVLGSDQTLAFRGVLFSKPADQDALKRQLHNLSGESHHLYAAAVIYHRGQPVWRHIGAARMTMRDLSGPFIDGYVARNWDEVQYSVGGYHIETEGARLFAAIHGDTFTVQGMPLIEVLSYLSQIGAIEG